jgi:uncharacterized membrane protein
MLTWSLVLPCAWIQSISYFQMLMMLVFGLLRIGLLRDGIRRLSRGVLEFRPASAVVMIVFVRVICIHGLCGQSVIILCCDKYNY